MPLWTTEKLKELSLFEVRSIAREIGVQSPTSFNKDEVIEKILDISSGKTNPYVKLTNKGRPAKPIGSAVEILEMFLPSMNKKKFNSDDMSKLTISSNEHENSNIKEYESQGYLDILPEGYGFIRKNFIPNLENDTFVPENMIKQYKLKKGDELNIIERDVAGSKIRVAIKINNNNNQQEISETRNNFENFKVIYPKEAFVFESNQLNILNNYLPIGKGQRMLVSSESTKLLNKHLIKMFELIKEENKQFIYFNAQIEEMEALKEKNIISFDQNMDKKIQLRTVEMVIENAKRKAELGLDCVVFINSSNNLLNLLSDTDYVSTVVEMKSVQKINDLILNGRNVEGAGSVTIIIGLDKKDEKGKILEPLLKKSINFQIDLIEKLNFIEKFPCIDFTNLEFDRMEDLISEDKIKKLRETIFKNLDNMANVIDELNK